MANVELREVNNLQADALKLASQLINHTHKNNANIQLDAPFKVLESFYNNIIIGIIITFSQSSTQLYAFYLTPTLYYCTNTIILRVV